VALFFTEAVAYTLRDASRPLMTEYDLFVFAWKVFQAGQVAGEPIKRLPKQFDIATNRRLVYRLEASRDIVKDNDFKGNVWHILSAPPAATAEDALCLVDPFCYVSFISAMQRHGLTNRSPEALHISTLRSSIWSQRRRALMREELPLDLVGKPVPIPTHVTHKPVVRRRRIETYTTKAPSQAIAIRGSYARISKIGDTFVDMLAEPALCGGMRHIVDTWKKHARAWVDEIIEAVSRNDRPIIKVRAGYLLDEVARIRDHRIEEWTRYAQRGGSRKLDPDKEYGPRFSEKWMIATNV
jgi:predicted transcriptional regulator of viral defense system